MDAQATAAGKIWRDPGACAVLGMGHALPGEALSTEALLERVSRHCDVDVTRMARALGRRLGVHARHVCRDLKLRHERPRPGDSNAALAARAVQAALREAGLQASDLGYLIGHTSSPGQALPPNIAEVASLLGYSGPHMELRQACTGFANALIAARGLLASVDCGPVAIVGSETGSVYFDPARVAEDHGQLVNLLQMGDGAAACIVASEGRASTGSISHVYFGQQGNGRRAGFSLAAGGSDVELRQRNTAEYTHDYTAVKAGGAELFALGLAAVRSMGIETGQVDRVIPHQVSGRIGVQLAPYLGLAPERIFVNADQCGNTGSAAIWLALAQLRPQLVRGERVLALGAEATQYMYGGFLYVHG